MRAVVQLIFIFLSVQLWARKSPGVTQLLSQKMEVAMKADNFPGYLHLTQQLLLASGQTNDSIYIAEAYSKLILYYIDIDKNNDSAARYLGLGARFAKQYSDGEFKNYIVYLNAVWQVRSGKFLEAYMLFKGLNDAVAENKFSFEADYQNSFAQLLFKIKDTDKAIYRLHLAAVAFEENKDGYGLASVHSNLGIMFNAKGKFDSAFYYDNKAFQFLLKIKDTFRMQQCYNNLGEVYRKKGEEAKAFSYYLQAYKLNPALATDNILANYSRVLINKGKTKAARQILIKLIDRDKDPITRINALNHLINLEEANNNYKQAFEYTQQHRILNDKFLSKENLRNIEVARIKFKIKNEEEKILLLKEKNAFQLIGLKYNYIIIAITAFLFTVILLVIFNLFRMRSNKIKKERFLLGQQLLRTQMNPGFVLDSLYNIQNTVLQKDDSKAISHIAVFLKLIRAMLENSVQKQVSFADEIMALQYFLKLQELTSLQPFSYCIKIDDAIEQDFVMLPPMLFQPILECVLDENPNKELEISIVFQLKENCIGYSVVGRSNAFLTKDYFISSKDKKVKNINEINARLADYFAQFKYRFTYHVEALKDETERFVGTIIKIEIPVNV